LRRYFSLALLLLLLLLLLLEIFQVLLQGLLQRVITPVAVAVGSFLLQPSGLPLR